MKKESLKSKSKQTRLEGSIMIEYPEVTPKTIWNFRQNNPELIVDDARQYIGLNEEQCDLLRIILLARGVNKWFKVRRDLIAYKKVIKHEIKRIEKEKTLLKEQIKTSFDEKLYCKYLINKELHKKLMQIRSDLKALCMTDRWQLWRPSTSRRVLKEMNSITCSD